MSASLLERLKAAVAPRYEVERELDTGGFCKVFLARDVTLERAVAIKILRPEMATAIASERFLREARILAQLKHPNVVPIHDYDEADGLPYYVMDWVQGETLGKRIERGPMSEDEVVRLGRDLLLALEATHAAGSIHRDVKPSNVFLVEGRALLGDFGIAKTVDEGGEKLTTPGRQPGTPDYMPPEQIAGECTERTDIYAVGMVLFEAATGKRWSILKRTDDADWSGIPRRLARVLQRALAWSPEKRWEDAASFRKSLLQKAGRRGRAVALRNRLIAGAVAVAVVAAGYIVVRIMTQPALVVERDLAVLPVAITGEWSETWDGSDLAQFVYTRLEGAPDLTVVPMLESFDWWGAELRSAGSPAVEMAADQLRAKYAAFVRLIAEGDSFSMLLDVRDRRGRPRPGQHRARLGRVGLPELSDTICLRILRALPRKDLPGRDLSEIARLTSDVEAAIQFSLGEKAFQSGRLTPAVEYYETAIEMDSSLALAWWHLVNAYRWLGEKGPYPHSFANHLPEYSAELDAVDSLLMAGQLALDGRERRSKYQEAYDLEPDYFAAYLLGEEMFNRGALWGVPLEDAVSTLEEAVQWNRLWALAHVHIFWGNVRLGRRDPAQSALERLQEVAADPEEGWPYPPELLRYAFIERFQPESRARVRGQLFSDTSYQADQLLRYGRLGGAFDVPAAQVAFGTALIEHAAGTFRSGGHLLRGLGNAALGRGAAIADFDSAAALLDRAEARLLAAEWRVLPRALGIPLGTMDQQAAGRSELLRFVDDETLGPRAAWALAMDAYEAGDRAAARRWTDRAAGHPPLATFLRAMEAASQDRYEEALATSDSLLALQTVAVPLRETPRPPWTLQPAPFARAALHLKRGDWYAALGDSSAAAEKEWGWYEAVDIDGLPSVELPQPGEIDWALGNYGRYLRGRVALQNGDLEVACRHLARVADLWSGSDPTFDEYLRQAREGAELACRP
ncbi:MAG: serine/threonine-protein kinase [Gemmatimonadales bacterium]|jgi:tetratricopeptide (TPR) repeat protein